MGDRGILTYLPTCYAKMVVTTTGAARVVPDLPKAKYKGSGSVKPGALAPG